MVLRLRFQEHPDRAIAIATDQNALIFRYSQTGPGYSSTQTRRAPDASQTPTTSTFDSSSRTPRCLVELRRSREINWQHYHSPISLAPSSATSASFGSSLSAGSEIFGTLGLIQIGKDVFLCVITSAERTAVVRPNETVHRIRAVEFYCLSNPDFDAHLRNGTNSLDIGYDSDTSDRPRPADARDASLAIEHPCAALKKALSDGTFYFSSDFDLTNRLQDRISKEATFDVDSFDESFLWNGYMIDPLIRFRSRLESQARDDLDASRILTSAIRGFVGSITVPASADPRRTIAAGRSTRPSTLTIISRLSCRRAGTRFNSRGLDDDGNVANFVETETLYWLPPGISYSYAQVRGSVPVFWEQSGGLLPQQQKVQITRSAEATQPAFDLHIEGLELKYGSVHVINLLSDSKAGEMELTQRYDQHIHRNPWGQGAPGDTQSLAEDEQPARALLQQSHFDFHAETRELGYEASGRIRRLIQGASDGFVFFLAENVPDPSNNEKGIAERTQVILQQEGVFRTNCLDCLDRTNLIQTIISKMALEAFVQFQSQNETPADFWARHSTLWADNGDALSEIYAGTGALKSSFTRHGKMSIAGALADARKSAKRLYMNSVVDKGRQATTDTLLGRLVDQAPVQIYDPINDFVTAELGRRLDQYSSTARIRLWVGTFNLNGKSHGIQEDLSAWLRPEVGGHADFPADVVAIGFQELVELSPQQIMSTDPARRRGWEEAVARTLNSSHQEDGSEYVLLRSGQLVGAALIVFARAAIIPYIKNVEGSIKKTGLSGMAGNKGAVACRMDFANTRLCFITAHLAAGFANYDDRNRDYQVIHHGLRFQRNRSIEDHDTVIWLGDFNYRIGLHNDKVRKCIAAGDLDLLYQNDQLHLQMVAGRAFRFYSEARITFMPTYKYDNGTDNYDTSEKARIPAWCDRVLYKGNNLQQIAYDTAPLRFSDHRPVFGIFECEVRQDDEKRKATLSHMLYEARRDALRNGASASAGGESDEEDLEGYEPTAPGLPPASSERHRWWLGSGLPARSEIAETHAGMKPNPERAANPFPASRANDWIEVSKPSPASKPNPPPHRSASVASRPNDAPQLPRKPASLRRSGSQDSLPRQAKALPPGVIDTGFPPPPRRNTGVQRSPGASSTAAQKSTSHQSQISHQHALPLRPVASSTKPKPATTAENGPSMAMSNLMDSNNDGADLIPSLMPAKPA